MSDSTDTSALDQFWRCPRCGCGMAMGYPARLAPPTCSTHGEMEQVTAAAFAADLNGPDEPHA